jgi:hypothetical protein
MNKIAKQLRTAWITTMFLLALGLFPGQAVAQWTTNGNNVNNTNSGNVGIGTASPGALLDVNGTARAVTLNTTTAIQLNGANINTGGTLSNVAYLNQANAFSAAQTINTTGNAFSIIGASTGIKYATISNTGTTLYYGVESSTGSNLFYGSSAYASTIGNATANSLQFATNNYIRATIDSTGNLGVGTTTPSTKLQVVGDTTLTGNATVSSNLTVNGNIAAKYQDVAEWVPSLRPMSPGTVMVIDQGRTNSVEASAHAYDTRVAGVVSARPGLALGESGAGKVLVATTGRVKVRADATRCPIRVGDLLVTSDKAGLAMKSEPVKVSGIEMHRPGTLIGKALEPLEHGTGEILVLLSLQ